MTLKNSFLYGLKVWISTGISGAATGFILHEYQSPFEFAGLVLMIGMSFSLPTMIVFSLGSFWSSQWIQTISLHRITCTFLSFLLTLITIFSTIGLDLSLFSDINSIGMTLFGFIGFSGIWAFIWYKNRSAIEKPIVRDDILDDFNT